MSSTFFKYQSINNYSIDCLKKRKLWKSKPSSFNDPFELRLMQLQNHEIYSVNGFLNVRNQYPMLASLSDIEIYDWLITNLQNYISEFRVICFTENFNDLLMWAHYADNHRGLCLCFEIEDVKLEGLHKVNYDNDYPKIDLENVWHINGLGKVLLNKSTDWAYENEWRKIFVESEDDYCEYPGKLTTIILGSLITTENEQLIREIFGNEDISIKKAYLHSKKYEIVCE